MKTDSKWLEVKKINIATNWVLRHPLFLQSQLFDVPELPFPSPDIKNLPM